MSRTGLTMNRRRKTGVSDCDLKRRSRIISAKDEQVTLASCRCEVVQSMNVKDTNIEEWQQQKGREENSKDIPPYPAREKMVFLKAADEDGFKSYYLFVENDNHEVFLAIFLEDLRSGQLVYSCPEPYRHEVEIRRPPRKLVLKFRQEPAVETFNAELDKVFDAILRDRGASEIRTSFGASGIYTEPTDETFHSPSDEKLPAPLPPEDLPDPYSNRPPVPLPSPESRRALAPPGQNLSPTLGLQESSLYMSMRTVARGAGDTAGAAATLPQPPSQGSSLQQPPDSASMGQGVAGSMPASPHTPSLTLESLHSRLELLAAAVKVGNVTEAQKLVAELALKKLPLNIALDQSAVEAEEEEFSVKVVLEDRDLSGVTKSIKVKPSYTFKLLKQMMEVQLGFPQSVQHWIVGRRIAEDKDTLSWHRVRGEGHTLYLYLVTARAANMAPTDASFSRQPSHGNIAPGASGDYATGRGSNARGNEAARQASSQTSNPSLPLALAPTSIQAAPTLPHFTAAPHVAEAAAPLLVEGLHKKQRGQQPPQGRGGGGAMQAGWAQQQQQQQAEEPQVGWECPQCTLINRPWRPGCEVCSAERPANYEVPGDYVMTKEEMRLMQEMQQQEELARQVEERERQASFQELLDVESQELVSNTQPFECPVCFDTIPPGAGVRLRDCLHTFCRACLSEAVTHNQEAILLCPYQDSQYRCDAALQDREIRALVEPAVYNKYLQRSLDTAEGQADNSYHCKTPDCRGWCVYEDLVNFFLCPVCRHENCLTCKAIHEGLNCKQYQEDLRVRSANDEAARKTQEMLERLVAAKEAMHCPKCRVILQKKEGCDWLRCSFCKTEICWVTRGPRWGPMGTNDTSGGCKCNVDGKPCDPNCNNCH